MKQPYSPMTGPSAGVSMTRRSAIGMLAATIAMAKVSSLDEAYSQPLTPYGADMTNQKSTSERILSEIAGGGGLLVVAQWKAKEGQAEAVAAILRRFLPQAQSEPGVKLFLISRGKDDSGQFLFYELFADEAAFAAHQASTHFKTLIAEQALPLLSTRERAQYALL